MAPQGWGHVLRHPSQAGLGLKEEEPVEWHRLVDCKACGAGCCLDIKSGQASHFTLKLRANTWGIDGLLMDRAAGSLLCVPFPTLSWH